MVDIIKNIKDFLCKMNLHIYKTIKCESGFRKIIEYAQCSNCKKEKIFYHKYDND